MKTLSKDEREELAKKIAGNEQAINEKFHQFTAPVMKSLPEWFQIQLLTRIDGNGNVLLSLIETERLLSELVSNEISVRK